MKVYDHIIKQQQIWASDKLERSARNPNYLNNLNDNLFLTLPEHVTSQLINGAGKELPPYDAGSGKFQCANESNVVAKMLALHSSSALVCNVFCYWYSQNSLTPLEKALGLNNSILDFNIEVKMKTGLTGIPPHLDVVFKCADMVYGIESKFTEPYKILKKKISMGTVSYTPALWKDKNLPKCAEIVQKIISGKLDGVFKTLDAPQLLKHSLGLANNHKHFSLMYFWFEVTGSEESKQHQSEIIEFSKMVGDEISFRPTSYQGFFTSLKTECAGLHESYIDHIEQRYFNLRYAVGDL